MHILIVEDERPIAGNSMTFPCATAITKRLRAVAG